MESLMEQMNVKLDKIIDLLEKRMTSQESQTDSSNTAVTSAISIIRHPLYSGGNSQYAQQERYNPIHLRYYDYHLSALHQERENAIREALKEHSKTDILNRLTYLLSIWNRNQKKLYIDNLKHDIYFLSNIQ